MKLSNDRIITTHAGSLPRPERLEHLLIAREHGKPFDQAEFVREVDSALDYVIAKQIDSGIDSGNDGEEPRVSFQTYITERMSGYSGESARQVLTDLVNFPKFGKMFLDRTWSKGDKPKQFNAPQATSKVQYESDLKDAKFEMTAFKNALGRRGSKGGFLETFVTAASPGIVSTTMLRSDKNPAYPTDRDYVLDVAKEMKKEYDFIVSQGHVLQLDSPDLAMERQFMFQNRPLKDFLERVELHVEALNIAVADIPKEKIRLHVCYGNWDGPHLDDVDLEPLLPILYRAKVGALSLACANPRHQHDHKVLKKHKLPAHMVFQPGVIDVTTNYLEHPEVVADRICQWVDVVGDKERVVASTDCGFATSAGYTMVAEDVVWAKLQMLRDGARIASERLWGRK